MPNPHKTLRDETLRRIGRNVVNFQKIEVVLKSFVLLADTVTSEEGLLAGQAEKAKALKRRAFGDVATLFKNAMFNDADPPEPPKAAPSLQVRTSLRVDMPEADAKELFRGLSALVSERNKLVHSQLADFDFDSPAACKELSTTLDEQNVRILDQLAFLKGLKDSHQSLLKEFAAFVESTEFEGLLHQKLKDNP